MNDPYIYNVIQPTPIGATYRGYKGPLQQWYETNFNPSSGYTTRATYRGLDWNEMADLCNYFTQFGVEAVLRNERGISTLTLTDATGNVLIDKWEMHVDEEQPSMFENLIFNNLLANASDKSAAVTALRTLLQNGDATKTFTSATTNAGELVAPLGAAFIANTAWLNQLQQYFDGYNLGVTNFIRGKYRLRHTTNAPARWSANVADFNVECIYTISQLLAECQNQFLWVLPLPGYLSYKIATYFVPNLTSLPNYMFGALKLRSDAATAANNRIDITTEYLIDQISVNLYPTI